MSNLNTDPQVLPEPGATPKGSIWMRGLMMLIFAILIGLAQTVLHVLTAVQFVLMLIDKGKPNAQIAGFGKTLGAWLAKAAEDVARLNAQGVIVVGAPPFMAQGVAQLRKAGVTQTIFVLSYVPPGLLVKLAGADGARGIGIAQTYPNPNNKVRPLLRDFQSAMKATSPEVSSYTPFQLEGYISARIVGEGLRRIRGEITPAALAKSLQTMGEIELGGFRIDFSKGNVGSSFVDIAVVDQEGRLRY